MSSPNYTTDYSVATALIPVAKIIPNPEQPRRTFDQSALEELAQSIRSNGVILPISVEQCGDDYILHDGERRLRAAKLAGLTVIPAVVTPPLNGTGPRVRLTRALIANVQRADMNPIDEARAYKRLMDDFGMNARDVSKQTGVSEAVIYGRRKLLELEDDIQQHIISGTLPSDPGTARALLKLPQDIRVQMAGKLAARRATVKMVEDSVRMYLAHVMRGREMDRMTGVPSVAIAQRKTNLDRPRWDALAQLGKLPRWEVVQEQAKATCNACALIETASAATCRDCPAVELLRRMMEAASASRS